MKTDRALQKKEKLPQKELRRDPAFRKELSEAWGVEAPPESFHKAMEKTYAQLPDGPIARSRPLYRVIRGLGTAAAACIALGIILIGLNATEPRMTEGMPGLGAFFQRLNEGWRQSSQETDDLFPQQEAVFFQLPVEDNGTVLQEIKVDGSTVKITAQVPFMGRKSYTPMYYAEPTPFGAYAEIQGKEASTVDVKKSQEHSDSIITRVLGPLSFPADHTDILGQPNQSFYSSAVTVIKLSDDPFTVTWTFSNALELGRNCVLTLYEWDGNLTKDEAVKKRVTAEFALDLTNATAAPSENYVSRGLTKITPEECLKTDRAPGKLSQGWCVGKIESITLRTGERAAGDTYYRIDLFGEPENISFSEQELALEYWLNDSPQGTTSLQKNESYEITEKERELLKKAIGSLDWYLPERGIYAAEEITESIRTGQKRRHLIVVLPASGLDLESSLFLKSGVLRFALRDSTTGQLLIEDLAEDLRQNFEALKESYSEN